jgi:hypothetical protein
MMDQRREERAMRLHPRLTILAASLAAAAPGAMARAQTAPAAFVPPPGLAVLATFHAEGAQIYECRAGSDGRLAWQFREPIATLLEGGRTVGRHYAGPRWELADGTATLQGRVTGQLPGGSAEAIPWLRLEIVDRQGPANGRLAAASAILRINTVGGVAEGSCPAAGGFRSVAYAADYVFLAKRPGD